MLDKNLILEDERDTLDLSAGDDKEEKREGKKDFNVVKMQRVMKLQQILNKNVKLREGSVSLKEKPEYPILDRLRPIHKKSLPLIKNSYQSQDQKSTDKIINANLFAQDILEDDSLLKKYRQTLVFNNQHTRTLIKYDIGSRILEENPQKEEKYNQRSILKLKVKNLQLSQLKKQPQDNQTKKLKSSMSKQSISVNKQSIERANSIQRLTVINKQVSVQKQQKKDFRRKKRNASTLNLTKIQHLPQIYFAMNKKCTKSKFPTLSMAQIDNNLIGHEIFQLEEKILIEAKNREKKQRMLKQKIKSHQKSHFLQSIYQ